MARSAALRRGHGHCVRPWPALLVDIHAALYGYERTVTDSDLATFIQIEYNRIGADGNITPREVIRDFIELLDITVQNPGSSVSDILHSDAFAYARPELEQQKEQSTAGTDFAEFTL